MVSSLPVNPTLVLKHCQRNAMHGRISPPLIKESARAIQMLKILLVRIPSPKLHIRNLEIAPEMAGAVPIRLLIMLRPALLILQPGHCILGVQQLIIRIRGQELQRLGP